MVNNYALIFLYKFIKILFLAVGMQSKRKLLIANFKFSNTGENESHQFETVNKINVDGGDVLAISYSEY